MSEQEVEEFVIFRELDEPITEEELMAAGERSSEAIQELQNEGVDIRWLESDVLLNEDEKVTGTVCRYESESTDAIREHSDRCGIPATRIARRGPTIEGE